MDETDQFLDIIVMRQLLNISSDNLEPIGQTFIMEDMIGDLEKKADKFVECLPSVLTLRPDSVIHIINLAQIIIGSLSEQGITDFKKAILQRLIHDFRSKDLIYRYAPIAHFLYTAVSKSIFESYEIANAVHSLMISKPRNHRVLTELFFWFAPHFSNLSTVFMRNLKHYVDTEQISRTLPARYKTLLRRVSSFTRANVLEYEEIMKGDDPLMSAIRSDSLSVFGKLVRQNGVNYRLQAHPFEIHWMLFGNPTLVQACAYFGAVKCFTFLVQKGADLTLLDDNGRSVWDFAVVNCDMEIIGVLVTQGCSFGTTLNSSVLFHHERISRVLPQLKTCEIETSVNDAILGNNVSVFANFERQISSELVMYAVECESSIIFRKMISSCPDIDFNKIIHGRSILHVAVETQQTWIISWLLNNDRVDVNIKDDAGRTPLQAAVETLSPSVISLLLVCPRVDTDVRWDCGKSILHEAILRGGIDAVAAILECERFAVNCVDDSKQTSLHYATRNINSMGTHILIDPGINVELLTPERYVFSYSKLVHTQILKAMLRCSRVRLDVFDITGVSLLFIGLRFIMLRGMEDTTLYTCSR